MSELVDFLNARLDEDEETARRGFSHPARWVRQAVPGMVNGVPNGISCTAVLLEVEAKRRIIAWASDPKMHPELIPEAERYYVLTALAMPYADHPDHQEAWRV